MSQNETFLDGFAWRLIMEDVHKSKRGLMRHEKNPFIATAVAATKQGTRRITNKSMDRMMIVSEETGEILAPAGFHEIVEVDKTQFVKLYINGVRAFLGLSNPGTKVFEIIYRKIQERPGSDEIAIHFSKIDQDITPISRATFNRGMTEILDKKFIAESMMPGMYFINVDFMFNGNRLAFIKEYRLKGTSSPKNDMAQLEAAGQQRLLE